VAVGEVLAQAGLCRPDDVPDGAGVLERRDADHDVERLVLVEHGGGILGEHAVRQRRQQWFPP